MTNRLIERVSHAGGRPIPDAATGEIIGHTREDSAAALEAMISRGVAAQRSWAALSPHARGMTLHAAAAKVAEYAEELADAVSREQGKPLNGPGARLEVEACQRWLHTNADLELAPEVLVDDAENYSELIYRPVGLVGAIGPWNWPLMIMIWQIAPALKIGNAVIVKPSEYTPLSVQALVSVLNEVLPDGVLQVVVGGPEVGAALPAHPAFGKIMFTGSTRTGKAIIKASAQNVTRLTLELGGNDAGIVLPGTDVRKHAENLFWGAFINTGQTCAALKRLYVHESQYDETVAALAEIANATPMGRGVDEESLLGPLQNRMQFAVVERLVEDAKARGRRIVTGGDPAPELGPNFFRATIVADAEDGDPLVDEEQFGPVLPVIRYADLEDAIARANRLDAALGASVWSDDAQRAREVALRLEAGTVWINKHGGIHPLVPFGGIKGSGYGLEFGFEGLKATGVPVVITSR
ncbi:aldehyde dehydrogenase family protein [Micromonospora sp. KC606]|uniref:aldehyde dehydrogenase family protein n=1 Tax=Micromonospora sp. KC606 TaxID=2530379 RepID=UPI001048140C|nr:aldehyde dehydrogenase family protein [Micromonospora sp. KC606]TDC83809.1 aldehyde dehydrogenase family protein [Micromonospora sp. KC606]